MREEFDLRPVLRKKHSLCRWPKTLLNGVPQDAFGNIIGPANSQAKGSSRRDLSHERHVVPVFLKKDPRAKGKPAKDSPHGTRNGILSSKKTFQKYSDSGDKAPVVSFCYSALFWYQRGLEQPDKFINRYTGAAD